MDQQLRILMIALPNLRMSRGFVENEKFIGAALELSTTVPVPCYTFNGLDL